MAPTKARTLSTSASSVKLALPTPAWTMPAFSARNSTWPPLTACTASVTFWVTVPSRGFGIRPRGPKIFPSRPTTAIMSGVAMARSKLISPACTFSARSSAPTISAPAASASLARSPRANTATRTFLPVPCGSITVPRRFWSGLRGSTLRFIAISTVSSNLADARDLTCLTASSTRTGGASGSSPSYAFLRRLPILAIVPLHPLFDDFEPHRPRRADYHPACRVDVVGVQILHLLLGDLADLGHRDPADRTALAGGLRSLFDARRLLQEIGAWRRLGHEGEAAVAISGDHHRDRHAGLEVLGLRVERLAELHDVEPALPEGRADRRRRVGFAGRHLQLDHSDDFLGHALSFGRPAGGVPSDLLDLGIFELDRGRPAEDRYRDLDPRLLLVDLLDDAVERGERSVGDAHLLADLENDRRLRPFDPLLDLAHDPRRLVLADRRRPAPPAEKAGDLGGVLDEMPGLVAEVHLDQHVAREELALRTDLGAALHLDDLLGRHQDLLEALAQALLHGLLVDRRRHLLLEAGIDVNHVPVARHASMLQLLAQPEQHAHAIGQHLIDHKEENRGYEYHHEHHRRRDGGLLAGRPGNPGQLLANLLNEFGGVGLGHVRSNHPHRPRPIATSYTLI